MHSTIIIPQRGNQHLTEALIAGIRSHETSAEIVVVNDDPVERPRFKNEPDNLLHTGGRGLTAAWNMGVAIGAPSADVVLLLNNDVEWRGMYLATALQNLDTFRGLIGITPRREPITGMELLEGWFLLFRRELWEMLGGFDERYRLYYSDTDFQHRVHHDAGQHLMALTDAPLFHFGHKTAHNAKLCPDRGRILAADRRAFLSKAKERGWIAHAQKSS